MSKERTGGVCFPSKGQTSCPSSNSNSSSSGNKWGGTTSSYPTGGSHGGGGSYSGGHSYHEESKGGSYGSYGSGTNTHGGLYENGYDYALGKHAYNISFKSIMDRTSSPAHGGLVPERAINLRHNNLTDTEVAVLVSNLQYQALNLDVFDVSNNKIGFGGVENLFYGLRFDNTYAGRYIVTMNFSNNQIGDNGAEYMAQSLIYGRFPHLKSLDVSGNQITSTGEKDLIRGISSLETQDIAITLKQIANTGNEAMKAALDFAVKGLKYAFDEHAKSQGLADADTLAVYGGDHCKKGLAEASQGIALGVIRKASEFPLAVKLLEKAPWYAKLVGGVGIFVWAVKDNWTDIANVDMMHCLAGFNDNVGFGQSTSEVYTQPLSGDSHNCEIF